MVCVDVVSLYPSVMDNTANDYPAGQCEHTKEYMPDKIGFYNVTINQGTSAMNIIPKREIDEDKTEYTPEGLPIYARKQAATCSLDWEQKGKIECNLSSIDIDMIIKHFGPDAVQIHGGYYFTETIKGAEAFSGCGFFKELKKQQDELKEAKSKKYNDAIRQSCKLFMNSLSGKVIQRNFDDIQSLINESKDMDAFISKYDSSKPIFANMVGERLFMKGKLEKCYNTRSAKPSQLGVCIYSHARKLMYDSIFSKIPKKAMFMTDTDSACMLRAEYEKHKAKHPQLYGKDFGQFDVENDDIERGYFIGKKQYLLINSNKGTDKMRYKGYPIKSYCNIVGNKKGGDVSAAAEAFNNPDTRLSYNNKTLNGRKMTEQQITAAYIEHVYEPLVQGRTLHAAQSCFRINKMSQHCDVGVRMNYMIKMLRGQDVASK
jgi:hypothetical protein